MWCCSKNADFFDWGVIFFVLWFIFFLVLRKNRDMLTNLDNEVIFKKAFTDAIVFRAFVLDVLGLDIEFDKIETEKQFSPRIGNVAFKLDIFAESKDKRVIVELQRVQYDHNFDRFLHYFLAAILELQKSAADYGIEQTVYMIVIMTAPYRVNDKTGKPVRDEMLLMELNPRTIIGEERKLYGHQFVCLNPNHPDPHTPQAVRDWLDLIYQSIHSPDRPMLNQKNEGIRRAAELISVDELSAEELAEMKNQNASKSVIALMIKSDKEVSVLEMNKDNVPISVIARYVRLSEEEVRRIVGDGI